jgi:hypothetical protein
MPYFNQNLVKLTWTSLDNMTFGAYEHSPNGPQKFKKMQNIT